MKKKKKKKKAHTTIRRGKEMECEYSHTGCRARAVMRARSRSHRDFSQRVKWIQRFEWISVLFFCFSLLLVVYTTLRVCRRALSLLRCDWNRIGKRKKKNRSSHTVWCSVWEYETFVLFFFVRPMLLATWPCGWAKEFHVDVGFFDTITYYISSFPFIHVVAVAFAVLVLIVLFLFFFTWNMSLRKVSEHRPMECSQAAEFQIYLVFFAPISPSRSASLFFSAFLSTRHCWRWCSCCYFF